MQSSAVEAIVSAAKADPHCLNQLVGVLGGSAGAGHAAFVALDETDTNLDWPFWSSVARPNFVVCLSGQYDLAERADTGDTFVKNIENYTNSTIPMDHWLASPIAQIKPSGASFIPMYFIRSEEETGSPPLQQYYMWNPLYHAGASSSTFRMWTIPNSDDHAFAYWNDRIHELAYAAKFEGENRVIGFFTQYLQ